MERTFLAVNGTLMRGLELEDNLLKVGGRFEREAITAPVYRLYSINDIHPAMVRQTDGGVSVALEIWSLPKECLCDVLLNEPVGLSVGRVLLSDGSEVLGVIGEPALTVGAKDISDFGGWRNYLKDRR